jgi:hypothetical protein
MCILDKVFTSRAGLRRQMFESDKRQVSTVHDFYDF